VPECTEAERALLDAHLQGASGEALQRAVGRVQAERLTPELRERVVRACLAQRRANQQADEAWSALTAATGISGSGIEGIWNELHREAKQRLEAGQ